MADQTAATILRTADPGRVVLGGAPPKWDGHGRTYRVAASGIDVKKYNDAVDAADQVVAGDQVDIIDVPPHTMILAAAVRVDTLAGAPCTANLRLGTAGQIGTVNCNQIVGTSRWGHGTTPLMTFATGATINFHFNDAPGNTKFSVIVLTVDMGAPEEEFDT